MRVRKTVVIAAAVVGIASCSKNTTTTITPDTVTYPSQLDTSFGKSGKVVTDFTAASAAAGYNDEANAVAVQSDGKIIVVGATSDGTTTDFAVARYTATGDLDTTFGTGGKVTTDFGSGAGNDVAYAVAVQSDGKIVVAGSGSNGTDLDFALVRYDSAGALDSSFGTAGKVLTHFGTGDDSAYTVVIQSDGAIVAAGSAASGTQDIALARYTSVGALDTTFNTTGKVKTDVNTTTDVAYGLAILSTGKIVAVGSSTTAGGLSDFAVVKYSAVGALDTSFGTSGKVTTDFGLSKNDEARSIAVQSDGMLVVAGYTTTGASDQNIAVARYQANGTLDSGFDLSGLVSTDLNSASLNERAFAVGLRSDGKIIAAGFARVGPTYDFAVASYNKDGSEFSGFGKDGTVTTEVGSGNSFGRSLVIQSDGKILVAGKSFNGTDYDFAIARYEHP